jgi:tRNA wybutosine-synthesizing protein 4
MENADSSKVLKFLTEFFTSNLAHVNFEMINPTDAFGMTMLENLEARGCQLLGLKDVPDEEAQVTRMLDSGFKNAHCENMIRIHNGKLDETERSRIEKLEMFDEFEEWDLLQTHYCICVGSKFSDGSELTF